MAELTAAYFDEFTHFSEFVFNYVRTRMRSDSKYASFIRCGLNPHPTHFVHKYLKIFIDQKTGYAIKEYSGRAAYYIVDAGQVVTSFNKEELEEKYPDKSPRKYTMIPSSLEDNAEMLKKNDDYREVLEANDPANAAMLLDGNWKYTPDANGMWSRSSVEGQIVDSIPWESVVLNTRNWDKAASKPAKEGGDSKTLDPDYTASVGMTKLRNGDIIVYGGYVRDLEGNQRARFRETPGKREEYILSQCAEDRSNCIQILPRDNGQGGVFEAKESTKLLQSHGYSVRLDPSVSNASKSKRFDPFCCACFNKTVYWYRDSFDPDIWDYMMLELENFNQATKNNGFHDDLVDCFSTGFAVCNTVKTHRAFSMPTGLTSRNTALVNLKRHIK